MRLIRSPVALILTVTFLKGCLFVFTIPFGSAPDEPSHFNYVMHLRHTRRIPVHYFPGFRARHHRDPPHPQDSADPAAVSLGEATTNCSFNPPLYYVTCAIASAPLSRRPVTAAYLCRLVSVALVTATVYVFLLLGRALFPTEPWLSLGIPLAASFLPQFTYIGAVINNDNLANLLAAILSLVWVRCSLDGVTRGRAIRMGVLTGLWFLTKASFAVAGVMCVIVLALHLYRTRPPWRTGVQLAGTCALAFLIVVLPLAIRNQVIYGDIAALYDMVSFFGEGADFHPSIVAMVLGGTGDFPSAWSRSFFQSFWGTFDWMTLPLPGWIYRICLGASLISLIGLAVHLSRHRGKKETGALLVLLLFALLNLGMAAYYCYYLIYQPQGRYLIPSLFPIMAVLCVGLCGLAAEERHRRLILLGIAGAMVCLNLYSLFGVILPHYG